MEVREDFTTKKLTIVFDDKEHIKLTSKQSREFRQWFEEKKKDIR